MICNTIAYIMLYILTIFKKYKVFYYKYLWNSWITYFTAGGGGGTFTKYVNEIFQLPIFNQKGAIIYMFHVKEFGKQYKFLFSDSKNKIIYILDYYTSKAPCSIFSFSVVFPWRIYYEGRIRIEKSL